MRHRRTIKSVIRSLILTILVIGLILFAASTFPAIIIDMIALVAIAYGFVMIFLGIDEYFNG
jgi:hypothetical protein